MKATFIALESMESAIEAGERDDALRLAKLIIELNQDEKAMQLARDAISSLEVEDF